MRVDEVRDDLFCRMNTSLLQNIVSFIGLFCKALITFDCLMRVDEVRDDLSV